MKIKIAFFIVALIAGLCCYSQKPSEYKFKNVIDIEDSNVTTNGFDYLFDVVIPKSQDNPVIFVGAKAPSNILSRIYFQFEKLP